MPLIVPSCVSCVYVSANTCMCVCGHVCIPLLHSHPSAAPAAGASFSPLAFIHKNRLRWKNKRKDVALQRCKEWTHCVVSTAHFSHFSFHMWTSQCWETIDRIISTEFSLTYILRVNRCPDFTNYCLLINALDLQESVKKGASISI